MVGNLKQFFILNKGRDFYFTIEANKIRNVKFSNDKICFLFNDI